MNKETIKKLRRKLYVARNIHRLFSFKDLAFKSCESVIETYAKKVSDFFFIQIGAHDGIKWDPIHEFVEKYRWKGILVEPLEKEFSRLRQTYMSHEGLVFENVAISNKNERRKIYKLKEDKIEHDWQRGIATLVPDKHKDMSAMRQDDLVVEVVECITFNTLISKHGVKHIDLLQIDTEGYDYDIIRSVDFDRIVPQMIWYEHNHLEQQEKEQCVELLRNKGYVTISDGLNTIAFL